MSFSRRPVYALYVALQAGNCNIDFLERKLSQSWLQSQREVPTLRGVFHWRIGFV